jgi:hypothetical protein
MARPLWQLLIASQNPDLPDLNCEECFAVLEYYAGQIIDDTDPEALRPSVVQHLSHCPECKPKFVHWLKQLE